MQLSLSNAPFKDKRTYSTKTRIKTAFAVFFAAALSRIKEHIPLKQGLRRFLETVLRPPYSNKRTYSTKTRIKTSVSSQ